MARSIIPARESHAAANRLQAALGEVQIANQGGGYYHQKPSWFPEGASGERYESPTKALEGEALDSHITVGVLKATLEGYGEIPMGNRVAVVREPNIHDPHPRVTAVVSTRFKPLQQRDVAAMLEPIAEKYPLEMIQGFGQWQDHVIWGFNMGEFDIHPRGGRNFQRRGPDGQVAYLYVSHVNDGSHGLTAHARNYRIYCTNQMPSMTVEGKGSDFSISIPHLGNVERKLVDWMAWIERYKAVQEAQQAALQILAEARVERTSTQSLQTVREVFGEIYRVPTPKLVQDYGTDYTDDTPDDIIEAIEKYRLTAKRGADAEKAAMVAYETYNDRYPQFADTWYTVVNAVSEVETWRKGRTRAHSMLFGERGETINRTARLALDRAGRN